MAVLLWHPLADMQILWTFSVYLEAVAILPQLVLLQRTQNIDNLTGNYVFLLGWVQHTASQLFLGVEHQPLHLKLAVCMLHSSWALVGACGRLPLMPAARQHPTSMVWHACRL